jgi:hypothetical protein
MEPQEDKSFWLDENGRREWKNKDDLSIIATMFCVDSNIVSKRQIKYKNTVVRFKDTPWEDFQKDLDNWYPVKPTPIKKQLIILHNTFADADKFKTIPYIVDHMKIMTANQQKYWCHFFDVLNVEIKNLNKMENKWFKHHIISFIKMDYKGRLSTLENKYDEKFVSYVRNYVFARLKEQDNLCAYIQPNGKKAYIDYKRK